MSFRDARGHKRSFSFMSVSDDEGIEVKMNLEIVDDGVGTRASLLR